MLNLLVIKKNYLMRAALGLSILVLITLHALDRVPIDAISKADKIFYDFKLRYTMPLGIDPNIVIVDIDEKSISAPALGRWPWGRDKLAQLVAKLYDDYRVAVIGFDIVWSEPDNSSGLDLIDKLAATELRKNSEFLRTREKLRPALQFDRIFAESLKDRPTVLGYYFNFDPGSAKSGELPEPALSVDDTASLAADMPKVHGFGANIKILQDTAIFAGHFNPTVDIDGVIRRVPLLIEYDGNLYESMSLAILRLLAGVATSEAPPGQLPTTVPGVSLQPSPDQASNTARVESLEVGGIRIPVDSTGNMLVPFRGPRGSFQYISALDVFEGTVSQDAMEGKVVLIGTTAPGLQDFRSTPAGAFFPGVEVHANAIAGMLNASKVIKSYPPFMFGLELLTLTLVGLTLALLLPNVSALWSSVLTLGMLAISLIINWYAWYAGYSLPIVGLLITILGIYLVNMSYGYFVESKAKRDFTSLFGQYVPPKLVEQMSLDPGKYSMEGKKKDLTILFTDIVGFTPVSEKLSPRDLSSFVNRYLTELSEIIAEHNGTIDKYIGDAIMAFWGAPMDSATHRQDAIRAALEMQARVRQISDEYVAFGWPPLKVAIGIASGDVVVGDMGSRIRRAYTVIGDTVNLAARLEAATRQYGVHTLIAESATEGVDEVLLREIDTVRVKGKSIPIRIFEPLALVAEHSASDNQEIRVWQDLLAAYRSRNWDRCAELLSLADNRYPGEPRYLKFKERISKYQLLADDSWDGVTTLESK